MVSSHLSRTIYKCPCFPCSWATRGGVAVKESRVSSKEKSSPLDGNKENSLCVLSKQSTPRFIYCIYFYIYIYVSFLSNRHLGVRFRASRRPGRVRPLSVFFLLSFRKRTQHRRTRKISKSKKKTKHFTHKTTHVCTADYSGSTTSQCSEKPI